MPNEPVPILGYCPYCDADSAVRTVVHGTNGPEFYSYCPGCERYEVAFLKERNILVIKSFVIGEVPEIRSSE